MPEGEPRDRLAEIISHLAERFSTTPFPPHVTLLPGIEGHADGEVLAASGALAAALRPFPVRLRGVEGGDEPFRCLFVVAALDEPLRAAHAAAARAFGRKSDPAYMPHLSLVYGALPARSRQEVAVELTDLVALSFAAARLHVWRTEGPVPDWTEIGVLPLGAHPS